jgi:SAM-dependent methyltransferase
MNIKSDLLEVLSVFTRWTNPTVNNKLIINYGVHIVAYRKSRRYDYGERLIELPFLFRHINPPPAKVLDIGCLESVVPIQLAMLGYKSTGIDIRDYGFKHKNFNFIKDDFNAHDFGNEKFDIIVDISAIEHFGLGSYGNKARDLKADQKAIDKAIRLLKPNGQLLFTAPFGVNEIVDDFERVYDSGLLKMFSGLTFKKIEYYKLIKNEEIQKLDAKHAESIINDRALGTYAVICINAIIANRKSN